MPIYSFECAEDNSVKDELRLVGDYHPPKCSICGADMERLFTPVTSILKGSGWSHGDWAKLRKRSEEQGTKFFKKQPKYQEMVKENLEQKSKEV